MTRRNLWQLALVLGLFSSCAGRSAVTGESASNRGQPLPAETAMKEIAYHGGVVTFRLPAHWREESDDNDSGVFFSEEPGAGTLRLSVITMRSPNGVNAQTPRLLLQQTGGARKIEDVGDGHALATYEETSTEDGQAIRLHFWELAHALPPDLARIAVFSFTIRADQASGPGVRRDLAMLAAELRKARFARELGVIGP